jgi:DMSO/TMAO reductase YedYZ heme-binding membrane subunit
MSSISNLENLDNLSDVNVDKISQDIVTQVLPYVYIIIGIVAFMCLLLIYISVMVTIILKRINLNRR